MKFAALLTPSCVNISLFNGEFNPTGNSRFAYFLIPTVGIVLEPLIGFVLFRKILTVLTGYSKRLKSLLMQLLERLEIL